MAQVELKNIVGHYGDTLAVDDVSFKIPSGQFVTLLGPSGCGKSSTLRIVAGLLRPTSGRVEFDGRDVTRLSASRRKIGMVFQSLALFPHMTVTENVAFGLKMKKMPGSDRQKQIARMLEIVQLGHLAERYPSQLSGGQQQRVALARALAIAPSILILDEPFGALDRKLREAMQVELYGLTRELGMTALFVTHDQEEALMLSDSIVVMNKGAIEQLGTPEQIYRQPRTQFVADFMGMTNFMRAKVLEANASATQVEIAGVNFTAPAHDALSAGNDVTLAVRPEKIMLATQASSGDKIEGRVRQITYHGNMLRYVVDLPSETPIVVIEPAGTRGDALCRRERPFGSSGNATTPISSRLEARPEQAPYFAGSSSKMPLHCMLIQSALAVRLL